MSARNRINGGEGTNGRNGAHARALSRAWIRRIRLIN